MRPGAARFVAARFSYFESSNSAVRCSLESFLGRAARSDSRILHHGAVHDFYEPHRATAHCGVP